MDESIKAKSERHTMDSRRRRNIDWIKKVFVNIYKVNIQTMIGL